MDNTVELIGYYGSDDVHACSAWTSTSREITEEKRARIPSLLKMLAEAGHHTPFEKSSLHFLVNCDIASHIHLIKHRVGVSVNGESARYKELKEDKYYIPDDWKDIGCEDDSKSFNYQFNRFGQRIELFGEKWTDILEEYTNLGNDLYHKCLEDLEPTLGRKRAKESARYFKGYNSQIQADVMFNWRSFYHFLELRNKEDAQKEIREIAATMLELVKNIEGNPFKYTLEAFGY
jgi:flavin-dependent thymidylate synthase